MTPTTMRYGFYGVLVVAVGGMAFAMVAKDRARKQAEATSRPSCCAVKEAATDELMPLFDVPAFSLTERSGKSIGLADLKGKVWVANFIYTRCPGPCPIMSTRLAAVIKDLPVRDDLRFVSFSVDPEHDTPAVLQEYAKRYGADPQQWLFATGAKDEIRDLSTKGFRLALSTGLPTSADGPIVHSTRFALVDREGKIRAYYDGLDSKALTRLHDDALRLLEEKPPASAPAKT